MKAGAWWLLACVLWSVVPELAIAQRHQSKIGLGSLPRNPRKAGFSMSAEMYPVAGNGYQPIILTFTHPRGRFPADRKFEVRISPRASFPSDLHYDYYVHCVVPQNAASESFVVYVPYYTPWQTIEMELREDGGLVEDGSRTAHIGNLRSRWAGQDTTIGLIRPADDRKATLPWQVFPDVRSIVTVIGDGHISEDVDKSRLKHKEAADLASKVQGAQVQFRHIHANELYDSWLGYSQLDVILVPAPLLTEIAELAPDQIRPLIDWVAAGGNLWIYGASGAALPIPGVDAMLRKVGEGRVPPPKAVDRMLKLNEDNDHTELNYEYWRGVYKVSQDWQWQQSGKTFNKRRAIFQQMKSAKHPSAMSVDRKVISQSIKSTRYGLGTIVTINQDDPFPGSFQFWQTIRNVNGQKQIQWVQRNGINVWHGNDHYWAWLIRAVGQPPVKTFFLLNSLFIIVIGPLCYFLFRRQRRLYLLLFFAPALALLVTGGLFLYGLTADGWQTRLRARQITWQDARAGYIIDQARQTYFSVFSDARGLQVPDRAAIYPVANAPQSQRRYYQQPSGKTASSVHKLDQGHELHGQFLPSRTQIQYMVTRPREARPGVVFESVDGVLTVTNQTDKPLFKVMAQEGTGKTWVTETVEVGESKAMRAEAPLPREFLQLEPLQLDAPVPTLQRNYYSNDSTGEHLSRLEQQLDGWLGGVPNARFIATTSLDQQMLGVDGARIENSVHVIMGALQ